MPNFMVVQLFVFELRLFPCLTNQRPSVVTMATSPKWKPFSKSMDQGLQGDISFMYAGIWESSQIRCRSSGSEPLYPLLKPVIYYIHVPESEQKNLVVCSNMCLILEYGYEYIRGTNQNQSLMNHLLSTADRCQSCRLRYD